MTAVVTLLNCLVFALWDLYDSSCYSPGLSGLCSMEFVAAVSLLSWAVPNVFSLHILVYSHTRSSSGMASKLHAYYSWHIIFLAITSSHQVFGQSSKVTSALLYISGQLLLWFYFLLFICLLLHIASSFSCVVVIYISVTFIFVYYFIFLLASHHQMFCFQHGGICDGMIC